MKTSTQTGKREGPSTRLRLSALACLLLILAASTAEVAHHHPGEFGTQQQTTSRHAPAQNQTPNQKDNEARCPLCIAMHGLLPVAAPIALAPVALTYELLLTPPSFRYTSRWSFDLFSRPPPSLALA